MFLIDNKIVILGDSHRLHSTVDCCVSGINTRMCKERVRQLKDGMKINGVHVSIHGVGLGNSRK